MGRGETKIGKNTLSSSGKDPNLIWQRAVQNQNRASGDGNSSYHEERELYYLVLVVFHVLKGVADSVMKLPSAFLFAHHGVAGPSLQAYENICAVPWLLKPFLGILCDLFPLFGYRRFSYLLVSMAIGIVGLGGLSTATQITFPVLVACLLLKNAMMAAADLIVTAKCAEQILDNPRKGPALMGLVWTGIELGGCLSYVFAPYLMSYFGTKLFAGIAAVPAGVILWYVIRNGTLEKKQVMLDAQHVRAFHLKENRELFFLCALTVFGSIGLQVVGMVAEEQPLVPFLASIFVLVFLPTAMLCLLRRDLALVCSFHLVQIGLSISLSSSSFYFYTDKAYQYPEGPHLSVYYYTNMLGIGATTIGVAGLAFYVKYMLDWTFLDILRMSNFIAIMLSFCDLLVFKRVNASFEAYFFHDEVISFLSQAASSVASNWQWISILVLQCQLCPRGLEATTIAFFASCHNIGLLVRQFVSTFLLHSLGVVPNGSAYETDRFHNLWLASLAGTLLIAFVLWLLPYCIPDIEQTEEIVVEDIHHPQEKYSATTGSLWRKVAYGQRSRRVGAYDTF